MRKIITSSTFDKKFIKITSKNNLLYKDILVTIKKLEIDVHDSSLKTHKLNGNLKKFHACSVNFSYRIIFLYDDQNVYLETVGDHDEVY